GGTLTLAQSAGATGPVGALTMTGGTFTLGGGTLDLGGTGHLPGTFSLANGAFAFNGGQMAAGTGVVYLKNTALGIGAGSAGAARFTVTGASATLSGSIAAAQSVLVQGNSDGGDTTLTATTDVGVAGSLTLQSASSSYQSNLTLAAGKTLTVAAGGSLTVNAGSGGTRTFTGDLSNNGTVALNTSTTFAKAGGATTNAASFTIA